MKSILVVDDERPMRAVYKEALEAEGFQVLEAQDAIQANEVLKKTTPDIVLLDLRLPGVDGSTMFDVISLFHKQVKVIVNSVFPVDEQQKFVTGAAGYNDKGEGVAVLIQKIKELLDA
jgi:CheY-like chemotaxis protein